MKYIIWFIIALLIIFSALWGLFLYKSKKARFSHGIWTVRAIANDKIVGSGYIDVDPYSWWDSLDEAPYYVWRPRNIASGSVTFTDEFYGSVLNKYSQFNDGPIGVEIYDIFPSGELQLTLINNDENDDFMIVVWIDGRALKGKLMFSAFGKHKDLCYIYMERK